MRVSLVFCRSAVTSFWRLYQRVAGGAGPQPALRDELVEMRGERARGPAMHALGNVVVDQRQNLLERRRADFLQHRFHLAFARETVRDQPAQLLVRRTDEIAVAGSDDGEVLGEQR